MNWLSGSGEKDRTGWLSLRHQQLTRRRKHFKAASRILVQWETSALKESFSMVAHLIGPTKWIPLTKQMEIFPESSFDENMVTFKKKYRNIPQRIWMILMHWKLTVGTQAKVQHLTDSLHIIDLHWLAVAIEKHLSAGGFHIQTEADDLLDVLERSQTRASRYTAKSRVSYKLADNNDSIKPSTPAYSVTSGSNFNDA